MKINLSLPRRKYYNDKHDLQNCPECGIELIEEKCAILLFAKSDTDEGEFMTNLSGSHFCSKCPVVVFDLDKTQKAATYGLRGSENLRYMIAGIIDLKSIPADKRHLEIGSDENPVPLVKFLPDKLQKNNKHALSKKKIGRNEPLG
jgi:hypothetical protein